MAIDVSVVVPTRNRSRLLATTLGCVLRQRDVNLELIVVDEASTDNTCAVVGALGDPRVRLVHHDTPHGVSIARNRGAAEARGEWVAFLDDDDLWAPDKLARQVHAANAAGRDWVYTGSVNIAKAAQIVSGRPPLPPHEVVVALPRYNAIPGGGSNVIVRRTTLLRAGPFATRLRNTEDWEMWIRLAQVGPPAWACSPLMAYRVHTSNSSLNIAEIKRGARLIEELHHTRADWGRLHRWLAECYLRKGQRAAALGEFARAALHNESANVTRDLAIIASRRISSRLSERFRRDHRDAAWIDQAEAWLRQVAATHSSDVENAEAPDDVGEGEAT